MTRLLSRMLALVAIFAACGPARSSPEAAGSDGDAGGSTGGCADTCSTDLHAVVDCHGAVVMQCAGSDACDAATLTCEDPCAAADANHLSVGCDYYATAMATMASGSCFAAFVANTWTSPAHISVDYSGVALTTAMFTRLPVGSGPGLTYGPYDATAGLAPGQVAILFLSEALGNAPCPAPTATFAPALPTTTISNSFHIATDVPVVAYEINPYGGGAAAVTGASLLLPTSAWDVNYVAVNVSALSIAPGSPSMNIVAAQDGTTLTITPNAAIVGGNGIPAGPANQPITIALDKGQQAEITQAAELTGSIVTSNYPVGFMAGQTCMNMPLDSMFCDHGEQMIPPVRAMGDRYVGVMYRPRVAAETSTFWRVVGAVDGTELTYSTPVGGPATLDKGQAVQFQTGTPFVVSSQDQNHPFMLFTYMTSSEFVAAGYGDPDFVIDVPPEQYLSKYVFFADPTYPETNLVLVRGRGTDGQFHDVTLDCAGVLSDWQPIGTDFEYTRADLMTGDFMPVGGCSTGRHEIASDAPFGLSVWGWGTPLTTTFTQDVSYGYPGGMNVAPINTVVIQ